MSTRRSRVLIAATTWWPAPARLAITCARLGFAVSSLCPSGHPILRVSSVAARYPYSAYRPLRSLRHAIRCAKPDLVIAADDRAAAHLHALYAEAEPDLRLLIRRSCGEPEFFPMLASRQATLALATRHGIRVPATCGLHNEDDLRLWDQPFPWVLKVSGSWGGSGVRIVQDREAAGVAYRALARPMDAARAIKRWVVNRDPFHLAPWLTGGAPEVVAQRFVDGAAANIAVACWQGEVVASLAVQALRTEGPTGPASIVRVLDCPEMEDAARRLARAFRLSGLHGLDFMLDADNRPWLIEVNPRATQLSHLSRNGAPSLAEQLGACITGEVVPKTAPAPPGTMLALFPQAWRAAANNPLLATDAHDVPWEEPALIEDLLRLPWPNRSWLARGWTRLARAETGDPWTSPTQPNPQALPIPSLRIRRRAVG